MMKKRAWIALILALTLLVLSGCGEGKKREEAAAMAEAGDFAKAYELYSELKDKDMQEDTKSKAYAAGQEAFSNGDYDRAAGILEHFKQYDDCNAILEEIETIKSGRYVTDVTIDGQNVSFTLYRADKEKDCVRIKLEANNDTVAGWIYDVMKPEDLPDENPCTVTTSLLGAKWSASAKKVFSFFNNSIFDIATSAWFNRGTMASFYKCVRVDGTEGLTMGMVLIPFGFRDAAKTFAGGKVSVAILDVDEKAGENRNMKGEKSADITE